MTNKFIYFFKCQDTVKIGISSNPGKRLVSLKTGLPFKLECLGVMLGDDKKEKEIQNQFKDKHIQGEWYSLTDNDLLGFELSPLPDRSATG